MNTRKITSGLLAALILTPALALAQDDAEITMRMQYADEIVAKLNAPGKTVKLRGSSAFNTKDNRARVRELRFEVDGKPTLVVRRIDWQAEIRPEHGSTSLRGPTLAIERAIRELANANKRGQMLFVETRDSTLVMAKGASLADAAFLAKVQGALFVPPFGNSYANANFGMKGSSLKLTTTPEPSEPQGPKYGLTRGLERSVISDKPPEGPGFATKYRVSKWKRDELTRKMLRVGAGLPLTKDKAMPIRHLDVNRK